MAAVTSDASGAEVAPPVPLPPGRHVELPGRGRTFVRELPGPPGAPVVLLLHGWTATADLNWFGCYSALGRSYRVVAMDLRGHGRGIRSRRPFRMRDCADDAAALVRALGCGPVIAVGYSMGGAVAQLLWRRHPGVVAGLVLCATAGSFADEPRERLGFAAMGTLSLASRAVPVAVRRRLADRILGTRGTERSVEAWVLDEMQRHDWTALLGAASALGRFDSRPWAGEIDAPTAVVASLRDGVVAPARQVALARSIPGAGLHPVEGDHSMCASDLRRFVPALLDACASVARRSRRSHPPAGAASRRS